MTISYKCSDTICEWRLSAKYELYNNIIKLINYEIKKNHSIVYEEHNYNYNNKILEDLKYKGATIINRKSNNPLYFKKFLIVMSINYKKFNQKGQNLLLNYKQKYGNIKFKIEGLSDNYKKYIKK